MTRKLDKEHLDAIQELRTGFSEVASYIGNVSIEKQLLKRQLEQLDEQESQLLNRFDKLREDEQQLLEKLKERYGDGEINIANGTFTPSGQ
jgi:TolA-binding protein